MNDGVEKRSLSIYGLSIIFLFSLFYCYDYLLQISISVFLPAIKANFSLNNFQLGLIGSIFFLSYVLMQVPGGYLIDKFGPWRVAIWMGLLCGIGALLMYFSENSYLLLLFSRLLIGLGSSVAFLCSINIIAIYSPLKYFSFFVGLLQALAGVGAITGQAPIAYLNLFYPWNKIAFLFFIISLIFLVLFLCGLRYFKKSDLSPSAHKIEPITFKNILILLKNFELYKISFLSFIAWSPVASLAGFWLIEYMNVTNGMNPIKAGTIITAFWGGMIVGSIMIPLISEWMQRRRPILIIGFVLQFIAVALIIFFPTHTSLMLIALLLLGFMCPIQGFCIVLAKDMRLRDGFGIASGLINMFGAVSGGVMQFVVGFMLTYVFIGFVNPFAWVFCSYLVLSAVGIYLCAVSLRETHPLMPLTEQ